MDSLIDLGIESGFVDWVPRYWPWSEYLVLLWMFCLCGYLLIEWWEDKK